MRPFFNIQIQFTDININDYANYGAKVPNTLDGLFKINKDFITLEIFYENDTAFSHKFHQFLYTTNLCKATNHIKIAIDQEESDYTDLIEIDLSKSTILKTEHKKTEHKAERDRICVFFDVCIMHYRNTDSYYTNSAELFLNENGFKMISNFYGLFGWNSNEQLEIKRMNNVDEWYPLRNGFFKTKFSYRMIDDRNEKISTIEKIPYIEIRYSHIKSIEEVVEDTSIILSLSSFYHQTKIDYTVNRIFLNNRRIEYRKVNPKTIDYGKTLGLAPFKIYDDFHTFLKSDWQSHFLENKKKLIKAIELFNQSILVDDSSKFLIRYNILEICFQNENESKNEFNFIHNEATIRTRFNDAFEIIKEVVHPDEHELFLKKWIGLYDKLKFKAMGNSFEKFLIAQGIPVNKFPIKFPKLKRLRDKITHGSLRSIDSESIEIANRLLYRITGILILNLIRNKKWTFNEVFD